MRDLILKTTANNSGDKLIISIVAPSLDVGPAGRSINYRVTDIPTEISDADVIKLFEGLTGVAYGRWTFAYSELKKGKYIQRLGPVNSKEANP